MNRAPHWKNNPSTPFSTSLMSASPAHFPEPRILGERARAWITLVFAFIGLTAPMVLNSLGLTHYDSQTPAADPASNRDTSFIERLCVISDYMALACLF